jgi:hypothetical protein
VTSEYKLERLAVILHALISTRCIHRASLAATRASATITFRSLVETRVDQLDLFAILYLIWSLSRIDTAASTNTPAPQTAMPEEAYMHVRGIIDARSRTPVLPFWWTSDRKEYVLPSLRLLVGFLAVLGGSPYCGGNIS